uniref:Fasciculation and elongation protein zeta 1 n=2 Tax=Sus scrofa TaxID=9823 RepID=A0A4X1VGB6_PIG
MEAPLVSLDEEFEDLRPSCSEELEEKPRCFYGSSPHHLEDPSLSELENFSSEIISFKSMEDLVNEFDEKLNVCFRNYNAKTENLAPVKNQFQIQEEEETLQDEEVWDALTDNYIPSLSEDWRDPNMEALNGNGSDTEIHEKEEEEFNEKSEHDSGINEEPLLTADQVIEEIEEMMQNSPDPEEEEEVLEEEDGGETSSQADSVLLQEMQALTQTFDNNWSYEGLRHMSGSELTELLDQVEGAIRDFSEELVQQLARRDELEFEKEVKNSFITVLIEVQNKQKEQREMMKKRRKEKGLSLQSSRIEKGSQMPLKYLNTVIPYEKKASPPSVEDLQMLTNILFAMKEDNEKVPTLLTDYILKGKRSPGHGKQKLPLGALPQNSCPPRVSKPVQTGHGRETQWTIVRRLLPLDVARRPEEKIPSPPSHQSDSTRRAAKPTKNLLSKFCKTWSAQLAKTKPGNMLIVSAT